MTLKIEWFFDAGEQGWSETFYAPQSFVGSPLQYFDIALQIAKKRVACLAANCYLRVMRISDPDAPRTAQHSYSFANTVNDVAGILPRDVAGTAARYNLYSAAHRYRRQCWLRGLPDEWIEFDVDGNTHFTQPFLNATRVLFAAIIAAQWSIQAINKEEPPNGPATRRIENITRHATSGMTKVKVTGHGYTPGQLVRIRGAQFDRSLLQVNRVWPVQLEPTDGLVPANEFLIDERVSDLNFGTYNGKGTVRLQALTYAPIVFVDRIEATAHDVGQVQYRRRGRARKRGPSRERRVSDIMGPPPDLKLGGPIVP